MCGADSRAARRGGYCVGRVNVENSIFVISTPVILNGGYIYTTPSLKEGNVCERMRAHAECRVVELSET